MLHPFLFFGRDGVIRTHDPLHPMQVRYQAALRPDEQKIIPEPRYVFAMYASEILSQKYVHREKALRIICWIYLLPWLASEPSVLPVSYTHLTLPTNREV